LTENGLAPRHTSSLRFSHDAASQRVDRKDALSTDVRPSHIAGRLRLSGARCGLRRRGVGTGDPSRGDRASRGVGHGAPDAQGDRDGGVRQGGVQFGSGSAGCGFGHVLVIRPQPPLRRRTRGTIARAVPPHSRGKALGPRDRRARPECTRSTRGARRPGRPGHGRLELQRALRMQRARRARPLERRNRPASVELGCNDSGTCGGAKTSAAVSAAKFLCDEVVWARVAPVLESKAKARAKAAGGNDGDSLEAHRLDVFVELLGASGISENGRPSRPHALVVVDAAALQRGSLDHGEHCEIEGIGSVSVEAATELLGEVMARFVIKLGRDVASVTSSTRWIPPSTAAALVVCDRSCVVPGCGKRLGLEIDHCEVDYADGGPTTLENLARLCPEHHDMKTHGGWKLVRAEDRWRWLPPEHPPSAGRVARARRLAAVRSQRR
jgi:hypothetical protein